MSADQDTAVWLYTITTGGGRLPAVTPPGVDGERIRIVRADGLGAVVGTVQRARFAAEAMRRRLGDLDDLAGLAQTHHDVIRSVAARQPVVPARLATIYLDEAAVRTALRAHADDLSRQLAWLRSRLELGVKAYQAADRPPPTVGRPATGAAYLRGRQTALASARTRQEAADARASALHEELTGLAVAAHRHRPQDRRLSGDPRPMILNAAYLLDADRTGPFIERVRAWDGGDLSVEVTGPWPPYSFAAIEGQS